MEYLVMETHDAYAVVLGENGAVIKAANMGYTVGDRVRDIVPAHVKAVSYAKKKLAVIAAAAACLCVLYFGVFSPNFLPYGTVRMTINPDIVMTVSRTGRVLKTQGLNDDGKKLIDGYSFRNKRAGAAAAELMNRASHENYLKDGGSVRLMVASKNDKWNLSQGQSLSRRMDDGVEGKSVTIFISYDGAKTPETVISTQGARHRTYTYDQWLDLQAQNQTSSETEKAPQWSVPSDRDMEKWGEATGRKYENWGKDVGKIFSDGFDAGDIGRLFNKLGELIK